MQKAPHKAPQQQGQRGRSKLAPRELLSTRKGTMLVGVWAALVAAGLLVFFLNQYRHGVRDSSRPATVLVAKSLIEKGTSGEVIATGRLFRREEVPKGDIKQGADTAPDALRGKVAGKSLYPGQQLTASSFTTTSEGVRTKLSGYDRAISVSVDASHGLIGEVEAGDHVDVLGGYNVTGKGDGGLNHPVVRTLVQNVLVLEAPKKKPSTNTGGGDEAEVTLRVTDEQAAAAAFTADNGKVWIALRPPTRAGQSRIRAVTLESLLVGLKPIELDSKGPER
jgi:Flp pilus assembly protein CpaB